MSNTFTLDSVREEIENEFAPVVVDLSDGSQVTLRGLLRINKKSRERAMEALKALNGPGESASEGSATEQSFDSITRISDAVENLIREVADRPEPLIEALDGDVHVGLRLVNRWIDQTQPGEASASPS